MSISAIIDEELESIAEQMNGVYSIPDLEKVLKANLRSQGHPESNLEIMGKWLYNAFRNQGDQGVIKMFQDLTSVQIEAVSKGRYMFQNLVNPERLRENNDEIQKLEGVGDKYAEKAFGIPDADRQFSNKGVPDADMGEKMVEIWATDYKGNIFQKLQYGSIYKNPRTLRGFDAEVRAIALPNGDLYVANQDGDFIHADMELSLEKKIGRLDDYIEFHRVGDTNEFGASDTLIFKMTEYDLDPEEYIKALEVRHPQFSFSTDYYQDLRETVLEKMVREELALIKNSDHRLMKMPEGTGDRYAEKRFGIPDTMPQWERRADQSRFSPDMGEHVGYTAKDYGKRVRVPIFRNPKSLRNFDADVRAVSDIDGNVYVAQTNDDFVHDAFESVVGSNPYDDNLNITWQRSGGSNRFGYSDSFEMRAQQEDQDLMERMLELKARHPDLDFVLNIYYDVNAKNSASNYNENVSEVITEEIRAFEVLSEGYSSYEEKQKWEQQYQDHLKARNQTNDNGVLVKRLVDDNQEVINIYQNPKSLRNFGTAVRAISDSQGNLFVGQFDKEYLHVDMADNLGIPRDDYVAWHRLLETLKFNSVDTGVRGDSQQYIANVQRLNPQFEFNVVDLQQPYI